MDYPSPELELESRSLATLYSPYTRVPKCRTPTRTQVLRAVLIYLDSTCAPSCRPTRIRLLFGNSS